MTPRFNAVQALLEKNSPADFAAACQPNMRIAVVVAPDGGRNEGTTWTDGIETWYPFIIHDEESLHKSLNYNLEGHVLGIGMTGWDWKDKLTHWVAFDFDSLTSHSKSGLTDAELTKILADVSDIDWVEQRYSTGGKGIHLYVYFEEPVATQNHSEHAALARAVLHKMSALVGYNFKDKVDICGGNMWVWHRKMLTNPDSLQIIRSGKLAKTPQDWRNHIEVTSARSTRAKAGIGVDELITRKTKVPLEAEHLKLIRYLEDNSCVWWWDNDRDMLVAHTLDLAEAHRKLKLQGYFETSSSHTTSYNCFCFPLREGGWVVRRFSKGCTEHKAWELDSSGWTKIQFNVPVTLDVAARCYGAVELPDGSFIFRESTVMVEAAQTLGVFINLPPICGYCSAKMREHRDGRLIIELEDTEQKINTTDMEGWARQGKSWKRIFTRTKTLKVVEEFHQYDDIIRHLVMNQADGGWAIKLDGEWVTENINHVKLVLDGQGLKSVETKSILGHCIMKYWEVVNIPFETEYPGNRQWNRNSARFRYQPSPDKIEDITEACPTWHGMLSHVGRCLTQPLQSLQWAIDAQIYTGADYLTTWIASLFQEPLKPLPYLFIYGPQASGKSTLHEALSHLMVGGYMNAKSSLTNDRGFNYELASAVLCYIDEYDLRKSKIAPDRIKEWVTAKDMMIHAKGGTPYLIPNVTKWIHTANDPNYCPVLPGDTRIVVIQVDKFELTPMPSHELKLKFEEEAPAFMNYIMNLPLPKTNHRLNVPVVETDVKETIVSRNKEITDIFLEERCFYVPGKCVNYGELYQLFNAFAQENGEYLSQVKFGKSLPPHYPKGRDAQTGHFYIGNISLTADTPTGKIYRGRGDRLILETAK